MGAGIPQLFPARVLPFTADDVNTTVQNIKAASGQLVGGNVANSSAITAATLLFFDLDAGDVVLASSPRVWSIVVPPATSLTFLLTRPVQCRTAISVAAVSGWARAGTGAPASDLTVHVDYF